MNKKQKKMLTRIIIAAVLMIAFKVITTFVDIPTVVLFIMYMVPYLVIGYDILREFLTNRYLMRISLWQLQL